MRCFFRATGDLAYKKIFPALHAMAKRGRLKVPVIGVAKAGWNLAVVQTGERSEPFVLSTYHQLRVPKRSSLGNLVQSGNIKCAQRSKLTPRKRRNHGRFMRTH
jgi:hypothetical protein